MARKSRSVSGVCIVLGLLTVQAAVVSAQTVTVQRNVNLRPEQSMEYRAIRVLTSAEAPLELLEPHPLDGYYHVKTSAGEEGYVWSRSVRISAAPPGGPAPAALPTAAAIVLGPGVPGSAGMTGCGDGLWAHVYHPTRLSVRADCVTVTGTIVDATAAEPHPQPDGVRHEGDGDTHGWLKVDPQFENLINAGNTSNEDGNLVFELVCHYSVTQPDAKPACKGFKDHTAIPKVGTHVAVQGTFVTETNHQKWNEIHPVTSIKAQ
jgi:hypothetical protein